ncbi:hypothetical protein EIP91_003933 [Steccherinum ochraceum]|uniref:Uncharacterized protein n=1 Tax=Steccherinum ochraceum TaxID=92696 RepID=A0A4R0S208_9APHY|nr:hypothetical protein EIP91_003933 [Steccherinum ochraceum]
MLGETAARTANLSPSFKTHRKKLERFELAFPFNSNKHFDDIPVTVADLLSLFSSIDEFHLRPRPGILLPEWQGTVVCMPEHKSVFDMSPLSGRPLPDVTIRSVKMESGGRWRFIWPVVSQVLAQILVRSGPFRPASCTLVLPQSGGDDAATSKSINEIIKAYGPSLDQYTLHWTPRIPGRWPCEYQLVPHPLDLSPCTSLRSMELDCPQLDNPMPNMVPEILATFPSSVQNLKVTIESRDFGVSFEKEVDEIVRMVDWHALRLSLKRFTRLRSFEVSWKIWWFICGSVEFEDSRLGEARQQLKHAAIQSAIEKELGLPGVMKIHFGLVSSF